MSSSLTTYVCKCNQLIATGIQELLRGKIYSLISRRHTLLEIYFVNKGRNITSFEMFVVKIIFFKKIAFFLFRHHILENIDGIFIWKENIGIYLNTCLSVLYASMAAMQSANC